MAKASAIGGEGGGRARPGGERKPKSIFASNYRNAFAIKDTSSQGWIKWSLFPKANRFWGGGERKKPEKLKT